MLDPPVTVVAQNPRRMGMIALSVLLRRLAGDPSPASGHLVETTLIERGSGESSRGLPPEFIGGDRWSHVTVVLVDDRPTRRRVDRAASGDTTCIRLQLYALGAWCLALSRSLGLGGHSDPRFVRLSRGQQAPAA
jgi:hypothetical protein